MGPTELATARAAQGRTLTAECVVGWVVRGELDEDTGRYTEQVEPAWSGDCSVKRGTSAQVDSAGRLTVVTRYVIGMPVEGTEHVEPGMVVDITAARHDAALVGLRVELVGPAEGTTLTLRRFEAKEFP